MNLSDASAIAHKYKTALEPYCDRIEIAGSIRRRKPEVKDIELVCIPKAAPNLFQEPDRGSYLIAITDTMLAVDAEVLKNGSRFKQFALTEGLNLDLFCVLPPAEWGVIFTIRTGPADFSQWIVTQRSKGGALPSYAQVKDGVVHVGNRTIQMTRERDFLEFCGLGWVEPEERRPGIAITERR